MFSTENINNANFLGLLTINAVAKYLNFPPISFNII